MQLRITKPEIELQDDAYNKLRKDLYEFIITTSDFPEWKQASFADRWSELSIKQLSSPLSTTELSELTYIASIRSWKNSLLSERDRVKALIYVSPTTISDIRIAVSSFVYTPIPPKP